MARPSGADAVLARLRRAADRAPEMVGGAMFEEFSIEMLEMQRRTPVEFGHLRQSGHVELPVIRGNEIEVTLGFGGPAAPYAIYVHEDVEAYHEVGEAKFVESVLAESKPFMAQRIANRIDLNEMCR